MMAKLIEHSAVTARLIAMCEAAGLNPNDVANVQLIHGSDPDPDPRFDHGGTTRVRFELYLTDAMAAALLGPT